jgi:hypothetical protein
MLRVCALQYRKNWDNDLSYVEFSYNNSYQEFEDGTVRDAIWS